MLKIVSRTPAEAARRVRNSLGCVNGPASPPWAVTMVEVKLASACSHTREIVIKP